MKAWRVYSETWENEDGTYTVIVHAENRQEARKIGAGQLDEYDGWFDVRAVRFPFMDDIPITPYNLVLHAGWWWECWGCDRKIDHDRTCGDWYDDDDEVPMEPVPGREGHDAIFCTPACRDTYYHLKDNTCEIRAEEMFDFFTGEVRMIYRPPFDRTEWNRMYEVIPVNLTGQKDGWGNERHINGRAARNRALVPVGEAA